MAYPNIEVIQEEGGDIAVGTFAPSMMRVQSGARYCFRLRRPWNKGSVRGSALHPVDFTCPEGAERNAPLGELLALLAERLQP